MNWDKLRMEFGEMPDKAVVLSEVLARDELFELYRLFEKEKAIRDFKAKILYALEQVILHPLVSCKKFPNATRGRYISRIFMSFYRLVKLKVLFFMGK